jgi:hypothetical protein
LMMSTSWVQQTWRGNPKRLWQHDARELRSPRHAETG